MSTTRTVSYRDLERVSPDGGGPSVHLTDEGRDLVILSRQEAVEELTVEQALSLAGLLTAAAAEAIQQRAGGGHALTREQVESLLRPNGWEFVIGELCTTHGCTPQQAERALREQIVIRYQTDQHFRELSEAAVKIVMHLDGESTANNTETQ